MAQRSKKIAIAQAALPLILSAGIKGTSIDKVVKAAGVSKPTVYNHFADKSALVEATMALWLTTALPPEEPVGDEAQLWQVIEQQWLTPQALRWYGLFMGEGDRAPTVRSQFYQMYDQVWRQWLQRSTSALGLPDASAVVSERLVIQLLAIKAE